MREDLKIFAQGHVGQVMVVMHQGGGKWAQVAWGASSLSRRVNGRGEGMGTEVGAVDKWIMGAGMCGNSKSAGRLIQRAKMKLCLLLHGFGWERVLGQGFWSPETGGGERVVVEKPFHHRKVEQSRGVDGGRW